MQVSIFARIIYMQFVEKKVPIFNEFTYCIC